MARKREIKRENKLGVSRDPRGRPNPPVGTPGRGVEMGTYITTGQQAPYVNRPPAGEAGEAVKEAHHTHHHHAHLGPQVVREPRPRPPAVRHQEGEHVAMEEERPGRADDDILDQVVDRTGRHDRQYARHRLQPGKSRYYSPNCFPNRI